MVRTKELRTWLIESVGDEAIVSGKNYIEVYGGHFESIFFTYTFTCSHKAREDVIELLLKFVVAPKKSYVSRVAVLETSLGT